MSRTGRAWILLSLALLGSTAIGDPAGGAQLVGGSQAGAPQTPPAPGAPLRDGSNLRVFLLTVGQGDAVWERFGHNAIWIQDEASGEGMAYNWGVFDFDQVDFIPRLIKGTMLYRLAEADPGAFLAEYRYTNRQVWLQELALSPAQKLQLQAFVRWNALPDNAWYRYDYYQDNCSTRVRDALDDVIDGRLWAIAQQDTTPHTYRWQTRRLLQDVPAAYLGIQFVLGPAADRPITGWEEMFLPLRLMDWVRRVRVPDGQGGTMPLVRREQVLVASTRPPEPTGVPFALPWFLMVGIVWGGAIVFSTPRKARTSWMSRTAFSALAGVWTLVAGLAGTLLLAAWLFTDHTFWYRNYDLFQANPLFLPLPVAFVLCLFRGRLPLWGRRLAIALAVVAVLGAVLELIPGLGQANGEMLALTLPVNLGLGLSAIRFPNESTADVRAPRTG